MITNVYVSYSVRPDAVEEHLRLIGEVFAQLAEEHPDDVEYTVVRLADGVSFVHLSTASTADGSNPLTQMSAFRRFGDTAAARVAVPPVPTAAEVVGSYRPARPLL